MKKQYSFLLRAISISLLVDKFLCRFLDMTFEKTTVLVMEAS